MRPDKFDQRGFLWLTSRRQDAVHGARSRTEVATEAHSMHESSWQRHLIMYSCSVCVLRLGLAIIRQQLGNQVLRPKKAFAFDDKRHIIGTSVEELDPGCCVLSFNASPESADALVVGFGDFAVLICGEAVCCSCRTDEEFVGSADGSFGFLEVW
jgi:hypothetical protein